MGEMIKLSSAARLVVRPGPAIQFGIDATRSGALDNIAPKHIGPVIAALGRAKNPIPTIELISNLEGAGLSHPAAREIVAELCHYGILRSLPETEPRVGVVGRGPLARVLCDILASSGCTVRRPLRGESDEHFLASLRPRLPLVGVDKLAKPQVLAEAVRNGEREWFLPVQLIDGLGIIGPLATQDRGPCPQCTQLHRLEADPDWTYLLTQIPGVSSGSPVLITATAAQGAAVVLSLVGLDSPPLGAVSERWQPGDTAVVNPFGDSRRLQVGRHSSCPSCFDAEQLQQRFPVVGNLHRADAGNLQ